MQFVTLGRFEVLEGWQAGAYAGRAATFVDHFSQRIGKFN